MRNSYVTGRLIAFTAAIVLVVVLAGGVGAQPQTTPAITVTVNKSMVFRLAERAKRVSVSQPEVADVLVVAPSQLLINGKNVGTTSLIIFDDKGGVSNYDLIVAPDISALRTQLRSVFPNETVEISTSGPSLVLRGEVSNEVVYDRVLEIVATYLPPKPPATVPPDFAKALRGNTRAKAAFDAFSPSHKREYVEWITEAKSDETRRRRMATALEWLSEGKSRNWKYERKGGTA